MNSLDRAAIYMALLQCCCCCYTLLANFALNGARRIRDKTYLIPTSLSFSLSLIHYLSLSISIHLYLQYIYMSLCISNIAHHLRHRLSLPLSLALFSYISTCWLCARYIAAKYYTVYSVYITAATSAGRCRIIGVLLVAARITLSFPSLRCGCALIAPSPCY